MIWILPKKAVILPDKIPKKWKNMARSIRFIAPVESLSGNLSGAQDLLYPTHDNSAFESPEDAVNYARNYKPRYVGTYRRKDGSVSFQVKTRTAVHMTAAMINAMAVMGGTGALIGAILLDSQKKAACNAQMVIENEQGAGWKSLRQFLDAKIRPELTAKSATIVVAILGGVFNNPWVSGGTGVNLQISTNSLIKFWPYLATSPITFKVSGLKGIAHANDTFGTLIASTYNTLGLSAVSGGADDGFVKKGSQYVCYDMEEGGEVTKIGCEVGQQIDDNAVFYLSDTPGEHGG